MISPVLNHGHENNGLITYIYHQLTLSSITMFQDYIRKHHIAFQEAKLPNLTVNKLITDIKEKIRVLKHAREWIVSDIPQSSAMVLAISATFPLQFEEILKKQIQTQLQLLLDRKKQPLDSTKQQTGHHREWKHLPPKTPSKTCYHKGKQSK